jgi:UDP-glucose 4-epimerase
MARLLLTGGAGFIGSHTAVVLQQAGHQLVVLDSFSNSSPEALRRVEAITGGSIDLVEGDLRDPKSVQRALAHDIDAVVHFAGLKAVGESVEEPLLYWDVNLSGSRVLLEAMGAADCRTIVFSSSATVYGIPEQPLRPD